jgi:5-methylcytosine-specific restriction endonuclease McrA
MSKEHYEGDHIIPWAKGGKTNYDNLQVLCKDCHYKKSTL